MRNKVLNVIIVVATLLLSSPAFLPVMAQDRGKADRRLVTGYVFDGQGEPLIGASVTLKSKSSVGTVTNVDGKFIVEVGPAETLVFSYVGMKKKEVPLRGVQGNLKVVLESDTQLQEVVIESGIIQRNKQGFTGSYKQMGRDELLSTGNINVLQSLSTLDPAFVIADNNLAGSNPNQLANVSLRGGSTMNISNVLDDQSSNPNEPLFILDGFETTLQVVNDLDYNRIESITVLKDAGSTAIYGSKGGNGVVVIETIKPKGGEVQINYGGDFKVAMADLSEYNMMNAAEKLRFEVLAQRYGDLNDWSGNASLINEYMSRLERVERGVDTYWLKVPLRTALTHSHSLNVSGGNKDFLYQVGVNYKDVEGVMKDSRRQSFGGNMRLTYRKGSLNVSNNLTVSITNGHDGAYSSGNSFSDFANANPYFEMRNADGTIPMWLDSYDNALYGYGVGSNELPNPLYNASLASRSDTQNKTLTDNFSIIWNITEKLRWQATASITTANSSSATFKDPKHTDYNGTDYTEKGSYSSSNGKSWRWNVNTSVSYAHTFLGAHNISLTGRASAQSNQSESESYVVTGFPGGVDGIPSYAYGYKTDSRPGYSNSVSRQVSFVTAFNYNYKYRYLFDVSYNADGTTAFGRNRKFQSFYSVGGGWNVKKEAFAEEWDWMQEIKLRGSYGINGNQNVSNYSTNVYTYYSGSDIFGTASYLSGYANPNLEWQLVKKASGGLDITLLNNRLTATFDVYKTSTDPMVVSMSQKPSSGVSSYPVNMGFIDTRGFEFSLAYYILRDMAKQTSLSVRLTGFTKSSRYGGFNDALESLNNAFKDETATGVKKELNVNSMVRYQDGESPTALWAVRSLGIDPATGKEVFLTKDGVPTTTFNIDDRVKVADSNPDIQGVVGINLKWKRLTANLNFRYSIGGYRFNTALFNKVENISKSDILNNQDRRALYDRWQQPGDIAQFKAIDDFWTTSGTQISSRFIQRDNYLTADNCKVTWDFSRDKWLKHVGLKDFKLSLATSEIFRLSTIRQERGIDYPFERSVSIQVNARF